MASAQATDVPTSAQAGANPGGPIEWFWRGNALQSAKAAPKASSLRRERLRRARLAAELADRTIDPAEPLRDGSALPLAITLFREAAYWALLAYSDTQATPSMRELLEAGEYDRPGLDDADFALVRTVLADHTFVDTAEVRTDELCRQADLAQAFVHGLLQGQRAVEDHVTSVLVQRWLRVGTLGLILAVGLYVLYGAVHRAMQGPDLALGKPWRASTSAFQCHPKDMECGGARSEIFFHTAEENKPWVEIDLGSPQTFSVIEVVNRDDCCQERATPLIVEVGNDQNNWTEVAKRTEQFRTWETAIKPTTARYVRLRVDRRTSFHLVRVSVRDH
ncbi:MAG: hypothetical protein RL701_6851 [Pseudomonadota bacterium]|jgi:hypothetical protein